MPDLITLDYANDYLGVAPSNKSGIVQSLVSAASRAVVEHCGIELDVQDRVDDLDGGGEFLILRQRPVVSVTSVVDRWCDDKEVEDTEYEVADARAGMLALSPSAGNVWWPWWRNRRGAWCWPEGRRRYRTTYRAGWALPGTTPGAGEETLPGDIQLATAMLVQVRWSRRDPGETQEKRGDWSSTRETGMPKDVVALLAPFREFDG